MIARHNTTLFFICRPTTLQHTGEIESIKMARATKLTQHESRQPMRETVNIRSGVQLGYAIAGFLFWIPIIWTTRAATRAAFGQRQLAGLAIS